MYANLIKRYNGEPRMFDAANKLSSITLNYEFKGGGRRGSWRDSPIVEITSGKPVIAPEVMELIPPIERTVTNPVPLLFDMIMGKIESEWRADAFHIVFHSSGHDSRIISAAIKQLLHKNGSEWLGNGLLFLSNRWEANEFNQIMQAQGWDESQYTAYTDGADDEHFSSSAYDVWNSAPCPIPGNLWDYLPKRAEGMGMMPSENVQAFCGLWANESWNAFLKLPSEWERLVKKHYGHHVMASLPARARWVEYPLVCTEVLDTLRRTSTLNNGDILRRDVAFYASPETKHIRRKATHDRKHPISERMQRELDAYYKQTHWGQHVPWEVPTDSELSTEWGRWSTALMVEELIKHGVKIT